jgi:hypothetical protein
MIVNHYGALFDSGKPTTGVFQNNCVPYLSDDMYNDKTIDITCLACKQDRKNKQFEPQTIDIEDVPDMEEQDENEDEEYICDHCFIDFHEIGIGFQECSKEESVFNNINAKFHPDAEYQALVGEICTQVINSKYIIKGALCSPCYPGQVDADTEGEYLAYSFPPDMFEGDDPIRKRIIKYALDFNSAIKRS